jgi:hypothetical protein
MLRGLEATLIFPCCVPDAVAYAAAARERGENVVAASSLAYDASANKFATWFRLPSIYDVDFSRQLSVAAAKYSIARIYSPVPVAHAALQRLARKGKISIPVVGEMATDRHAREHRDLMDSARVAHDLIQAMTERRSPLSVLEVASVLRQCAGIFGESDEAKIAAMMAIFADAPPGDTIEIGVLAGRTACALALMAQRHGTGPVLVVDPWNTAEAFQAESTKDVQTVLESWNTAAQFESFAVALLPIAASGRFNYLVGTSRQACRFWSDRKTVETPLFGTVRYSGAISILHVDGNHDFAHVSEDCAQWLPHLVPRGWLILDDYVSYHCDGPRRVGNSLLEEHARRVERAFVCGKALFIKLAGRSHA